MEILDRKTVWQGKYLRSVTITYRDSSGATRNWETFERVNCDGVVAIVPVTKDGKILFVRQFRPAVKGYVIEFPAGLNDQGESLEDAAQRELSEETGYSAEELIFLAEGPISSGASGEILTAFLAKGLEFKGTGKSDETEDIEVFEIPINEIQGKLSAFTAQGDYVDLKVFGLIELARKYL